MSSEDGANRRLPNPTIAERARDPRTYYARVRDAEPLPRDGSVITLYRHGDVRAVLSDPGLFSSAARDVSLGSTRPLIPLEIDPPQHVRYRRLLDPLFAPRAMAPLEPMIVERINDLIDAFIDRGTCDFASEFATVFPTSVFLEMIGLPLSRLSELLALKDDIIRPAGATPEDAAARQAQAGAATYALFTEALQERSAHPGDDLLSRFLQFELDGERLTFEEVLDISFLFLLAGLDTVTDALEVDFAYLATHPDQRRQIVEDPDIIPGAVEELLRFESPVQAVNARRCTRDTEIAGCPVRAGESVNPLIGSANVDPAAVDDPNRVDFARNPNRHLAFGGGVHRCLGSHLARLELRLVFREWHRRIPDYTIEAGHELNYDDGGLLRTVEPLPLVFSAGGR